MPYLNLELNYFDHPKTLRLVGLLGKGSEVLPIKLWCYCGKHHSESGRLAEYSAQEIESILGWWGDPGKLVEAMVKIGFLKMKGEIYEISGWKEHQGHLAAFKKRAKLAARKRWSKMSVDATSIASSIAKRRPKQCPNLTVPNQLNKETAGQSRKPVDNSQRFKKASPAFQAVLKAVSDEGLNIYALINRFYKESNLIEDLPESVIKAVCWQYLQDKDKVKKQWPWFCTVLRQESAKFHADKNIQEHKDVEKDGPTMIGDLIKIG